MLNYTSINPTIWDIKEFWSPCESVNTARFVDIGEQQAVVAAGSLVVAVMYISGI